MRPVQLEQRIRSTREVLQLPPRPREAFHQGQDTGGSRGLSSPGHGDSVPQLLFLMTSLSDTSSEHAVRKHDGEIITAQNGRFGPYISKGKDSRTLQNEEQILTITLEEALALLATPRVFGRGRAAPKPPLKEFGNDPVSGKPVVAKEGRFGEYVTDGETNAGLKRGDILQDMNPERAYELLQLRREYIEENGGAPKKRGAKKVAAKKAPAKKAPAKKAPAKKAAAKKATVKKAAAKKPAKSTDDS